MKKLLAALVMVAFVMTGMAMAESKVIVVGCDTNFMPFEFKAGYTLPILGQGTSAASTLVIQLKTFLKF